MNLKHVFVSLFLCASLVASPTMPWLKSARGPSGSAPAGPTAYLQLKLNEGTGTTANDDGTGNNDGTLTGGATWTTGPNSNGAVALDGTDDYVAVANESNFDRERTDAWSISAWVKVNSGASGGQPIAVKKQASGNQPGFEIFVDTTNDRVRVFIADSTAAELQVNSANSSFSINAWHHVVVTYDGSSSGAGLKVYVDNGSAATGSGTVSNSILNDSALNIGYNNASALYLNGVVDDFRFYLEELSSGDVSTIYIAGAQ